MIVRLISTQITDESNNILNNNISNYLKDGDTFEVFGMRFFQRATYFMVYANERHLIELPIELFEIINSKMSIPWEAKMDQEGLRLWPEIFFSPYFFDNFSEDCENERSSFRALVKLLGIDVGNI